MANKGDRMLNSREVAFLLDLSPDTVAEFARRNITAVGGTAGGFRRLDERRQHTNQQQSNVAAAGASQQANYSRAMSACLEGRGYSVK